MHEVAPKDREFPDYGKNSFTTSNHEGGARVLIKVGSIDQFENRVSIKVICWNRPSIIGRDLLDELGLQLIQKVPGQHVISIQDDKAEDDDKQEYFRKLFSNLFKQVEKIRNCKVQAKFVANLMPIQKK